MAFETWEQSVLRTMQGLIDMQLKAFAKDPAAFRAGAARRARKRCKELEAGLTLDGLGFMVIDNVITAGRVPTAQYVTAMAFGPRRHRRRAGKLQELKRLPRSRAA